MCYPAGKIERGAYHPYRYHKPAPRRDVVRLLEEAGFHVERARTVIFIWKNLPDALVPLGLFLESILESVPLVRGLGSTLIVLAKKPSNPSREDRG